MLIEGLLPLERWNLHDALVRDIAVLEAASQEAAPWRALLSPIYKNDLLDVVNIMALPGGLWFQTVSTRWSVRLQVKDPYRPTSIAWQMCSPAETGTWPPTLRLVVNDNIKIQFEVLRAHRPINGGWPLDPIQVRFHVVAVIRRHFKLQMAIEGSGR